MEPAILDPRSASTWRRFRASRRATSTPCGFLWTSSVSRRTPGGTFYYSSRHTARGSRETYQPTARDLLL